MPLSIYESTRPCTIYEKIHYYILEFLHEFEFFYNSKYRIPRNKIEALVLLKKHDKKFCNFKQFAWLIISQWST